MSNNTKHTAELLEELQGVLRDVLLPLSEQHAQSTNVDPDSGSELGRCECSICAYARTVKAAIAKAEGTK